MSIRPMTVEEIRRDLLHGAQVCCDDGRRDWGATDVLPQDGAFDAAASLGVISAVSWLAKTPEVAANYLLLVRAAIE